MVLVRSHDDVEARVTGRLAGQAQARRLRGLQRLDFTRYGDKADVRGMGEHLGRVGRVDDDIDVGGSAPLGVSEVPPRPASRWTRSIVSLNCTPRASRSPMGSARWAKVASRWLAALASPTWRRCFFRRSPSEVIA